MRECLLGNNQFNCHISIWWYGHKVTSFKVFDLDIETSFNFTEIFDHICYRCFWVDSGHIKLQLSIRCTGIVHIFNQNVEWRWIFNRIESDIFGNLFMNLEDNRHSLYNLQLSLDFMYTYIIPWSLDTMCYNLKPTIFIEVINKLLFSWLGLRHNNSLIFANYLHSLLSTRIYYLYSYFAI